MSLDGLMLRNAMSHQVGSFFHSSRFNLKSVAECENAVQATDAHREGKNCAVTFWVMSQCEHLQGVGQTFVIQLLFLG